MPLDVHAEQETKQEGQFMKQNDHHSRSPQEPPVRDIEMLASATECTGLTPAAIQTPEEGENYAELYAIHQQKPAWNQGKIKDENE